MIKIVKHEYSINFIDENDRFIGMESRRDCCEEFGFRIVKNGKILWDISYCRYSPEERVDIECLLKDYYLPEKNTIVIEEEVGEWRGLGRKSVTVLLPNTEDEVHIEMYNFHNGYYGHEVFSGIDKTQEVLGYIL